ncbi:molybdopterin molybdotransferase MoeA [Nesterenkonia marinintestina]|uniref:molybdopterin molybdotransferase MoeA n=1 Tax=Nesterenkonia marinintestina TaxID=2979865 RepID=UPI0021BE146E|nr:gephyrin-like molybdotransferase Glp [Nesterenkonia sp. GX14115]
MTAHDRGGSGFRRRSLDAHRRAMTELLLATGGPSAHGRTEVVPTADALGRLTARAVRAEVPLPRFDDSQMDGFAVRAAETPGVLRTTDPVPAGGLPEALPPRCAAPIMTGAPLPEGADAVVPVEATDAERFDPAGAGPDSVEVPRTGAGTYVRRRGSDVDVGDEVLSAGARLTAAGIGVLASLGLTETEVVARPRAMVLVGGDEVVPPGSEIGPGQVYDANGGLLSGWLAARGLEVVAVRIVDDSEGRFAARLRADLALHGPDLVVTSGGISAGRYEVVRQSLASMPEAEMSIGTLAMQPGGPQGLGTVGVDGRPPAAVVSLPGNPVSTWVSCEALLVDALAEAWGLPRPHRWRSARLGRAARPAAEKDQIRRGRCTPRGAGDVGPSEVVAFEGTGSHLLAGASRADVLIRLPAGDEELPPGTTVTVRDL